MEDKVGQASIETLAGVSIVIFLFVMISVDSVNKSATHKIVEGVVKDGARCRSLAEAITSAYVLGENMVMKIETDFDANVSENRVLVGYGSCPVIGRVQDAGLESGTVVLKNLSGTVVLENE